MSHFCYTILMYRLCVLMGILSCATAVATGGVDVRMPSVDRESAMASEYQTRRLLQDIERIRGTRDMIDCDGLEPIPLYEGSPSLLHWTAFCLARVHRDVTACDALPAMLTPDLRTLCHGA